MLSPTSVLVDEFDEWQPVRSVGEELSLVAERLTEYRRRVYNDGLSLAQLDDVDGAILVGPLVEEGGDEALADGQREEVPHVGKRRRTRRGSLRLLLTLEEVGGEQGRSPRDRDHNRKADSLSEYA